MRAPSHRPILPRLVAPGRTWLRRAVGAWLVLGVVSALSCGPSYYTARLLPAQRAVARAREVGAEQTSPYLYWYAVAHLDKAREEAGESSYQRAARYASRARRAAEQAEAQARTLAASEDQDGPSRRPADLESLHRAGTLE